MGRKARSLSPVENVGQATYGSDIRKFAVIVETLLDVDGATKAKQILLAYTKRGNGTGLAELVRS